MQNVIDSLLEILNLYFDAWKSLISNTFTRWLAAITNFRLLLFPTPGIPLVEYLGQFVYIPIEELDTFRQKLMDIPLQITLDSAARAVPVPAHWGTRVMKGDDAVRALLRTLSVGGWQALNFQLPLAVRVGQWISSRFSIIRLLLNGLSRLTILKKVFDLAAVVIWALFTMTIRTAGTIGLLLVLVWLAGEMEKEDNFIEKLLLQQNNKLVKDRSLGRKRESAKT